MEPKELNAELYNKIVNKVKQYEDYTKNPQANYRHMFNYEGEKFTPIIQAGFFPEIGKNGTYTIQFNTNIDADSYDFQCKKDNVLLRNLYATIKNTAKNCDLHLDDLRPANQVNANKSKQKGMSL